MRIAINAFPARSDGGGARYVFAGLLDALLKIDQQNHYVIFTHYEALRLIYGVLHAHVGPRGDVGPDPRVKIVEIAEAGQIYQHSGEFDLYFAPMNNLQPRIYDRPTVAILHDIQEQYFPEYFAKAELMGRYEDYPEICHAATVLIAISNAVKQSFVEKFGVDPRKIEVIHNAPQAGLVNRPPEDKGLWDRPPLPPQFFFYPANTYKHKNHELLLDALAAMRQRDGDCPNAVFVGFQLPGGFPLSAEIKRRRLDDRCCCFTEMSVDEMRYLYCHALATVMPTMFEGFGIPSVESLACGCPLICSDLPVLREIVGDNACYFPPNDREALIAQLRRIASDPSLRQTLGDRGRAILAAYNWESSAAKLLQIFDSAHARFRWGPGGQKPATLPRIGVLIRLIHGGSRIIETIKSLLVCGYPNLRIRVIGRHRETANGLMELFNQSLVEYVADDAPADVGLRTLLKFADESGAEIVGEALEGHAFKSSAMDSLLWGFTTAPDKSIYLGEAMEWQADHFLRIARMRLTGDGLWKMEGFLFPEILFINVSSFSNWRQDADSLASDPIEWRWDLLRTARTEQQLFLLRRTLADCDLNSVGVLARYHAVRAGMYRFYSVEHDRRVKIGALRRVQPVVKSLASILPQRWQDRGTRVWYSLIR